MDSKESCNSWFCVLNNPQKLYEGEPNEIAETVLNLWLDGHTTRSGAVAYCISADGLHHLHMVLEDKNKARFSALKKLYNEAHLEPTRGSKQQAEDYINKVGKFEEKGEQVLYIAKYGEIKGSQGKRNDLDEIDELLKQGLTPNKIFDISISYRRYEKIVRSAFFDKRKNEIPFNRDVNTIWHIGDSGSGKTYEAVKLVEKYGEENVYMVRDYENGCFDNYNGEPILFMDEFRGQLRFSTLLGLLDGYKAPLHARYSNIYPLWTQVHITSVLPPERVYAKMVSENQDLDTIAQLLRRINYILLHYKTNEEYHTFELPMCNYQNYEDLVNLAFQGKETWREIDESSETFPLPF